LPLALKLKPPVAELLAGELKLNPLEGTAAFWEGAAPKVLWEAAKLKDDLDAWFVQVGAPKALWVAGWFS